MVFRQWWIIRMDVFEKKEDDIIRYSVTTNCLLLSSSLLRVKPISLGTHCYADKKTEECLVVPNKKKQKSFFLHHHHHHRMSKESIIIYVMWEKQFHLWRSSSKNKKLLFSLAISMSIRPFLFFNIYFI
jgi:hypothetical protein